MEKVRATLTNLIENFDGGSLNDRSVHFRGKLGQDLDRPFGVLLFWRVENGKLNLYWYYYVGGHQFTEPKLLKNFDEIIWMDFDKAKDSLESLSKQINDKDNFTKFCNYLTAQHKSNQ